MPPRRYLAPAAIVDFSNSASIRRSLSPEQGAAVERILTDPTMEPVWAELGRPGRPATDMEAFIETCAKVWRLWLRLSGATKGQIEERLATIASTTEGLAAELRSTPEDFELHGTPLQLGLLIGRAMLEGRIGRDDQELDLPPTKIPSQTPWDELRLSQRYTGGEMLPIERMAVPHILDALVILLRAHTRPALYDIRPRRINYANAKAVFFTRVFAHFFLTHGNAAHYRLVAIVVNVLFNFETTIDAELAKKNSRELEKIFRDVQQRPDEYDFT